MYLVVNLSFLIIVDVHQLLLDYGFSPQCGGVFHAKFMLFLYCNVYVLVCMFATFYVTIQFPTSELKWA